MAFFQDFPVLENAIIKFQHFPGFPGPVRTLLLPREVQAPVVQRLDNAIHRINRYPADKSQQNKPRYPLDSDLSGG